MSRPNSDAAHAHAEEGLERREHHHYCADQQHTDGSAEDPVSRPTSPSTVAAAVITAPMAAANRFGGPAV